MHSILQHLREVGVNIQCVICGHPVDGLPQAVAQPGVGIDGFTVDKRIYLTVHFLTMFCGLFNTN